MLFEKGKMEEEKDEKINKGFEDYEDLPKDEVVRKDGLPTVEDLKEIFGKKRDMKAEQDEEDRQSVKDFIEVIIRIDK